MEKHKGYILPIIVIAQFCCTSLWFAGNGIMKDLATNFQVDEQSVSILTSSVQLGFIIGTLSFAILSIADRYSPSKVFFACALLGSTFNLGILYTGNTLYSLLLFRFLTGFFLAGIYPVGMKIAADYYVRGLGKSLGYLVGALVLGTASSHFIAYLGSDVFWESVIIIISSMAVIGGILILMWVPDGPYRKQSQETDLKTFWKVFSDNRFRTAAIGYFGHMWELYAFWTFIPLILMKYAELHIITDLDTSLYSFIIIGIGGPACVIGGYLAEKTDLITVARSSILVSAICCLICPWVLAYLPWPLSLLFLLLWGMSVIMDSPMFSTMVAQRAPEDNKGTALTIVNCIGFAITIISIQLASILLDNSDSLYIYMILAVGPAIALFFMRGSNIA